VALIAIAGVGYAVWWKLARQRREEAMQEAKRIARIEDHR
jgi:cbb3-type cytochrome oxidase subunit 3